MKKIKTTMALLVAILAVFLFPIQQVSANDISYRNDAEDTVVQAIRVFNEMSHQNLEDILPVSVLEKAAGIVVFPDATSFAVYDRASSMGKGLIGGKSNLIVGASWGRGVVLTKWDDGKWNSPFFITFNGPSLSNWDGEETLDLVLVINSHDVLDGLAAGKKLKLRKSSTVTAGTMGRSATASKDSEIFAYKGTSGLFTGASDKGIVLDISNDHTLAYYDLNTNENQGVRGYHGDLKGLNDQFLTGKKMGSSLPASAENLITAADAYVAFVTQCE